MAEQIDQERSDSAYEKWKYYGSAFPFRWAFSGLLFVAVVGATMFERVWGTPYRFLAIGTGLLFLFGLLKLFHDIPRRRLGLVSKAFLSLGVVVLAVVCAWAIFKRVGPA